MERWTRVGATLVVSFGEMRIVPVKQGRTDGKVHRAESQVLSSLPRTHSPGEAHSVLNLLVRSILTQLGADLSSIYIPSNLCALVDPFLQRPKRLSGNSNLLLT